MGCGGTECRSRAIFCSPQEHLPALLTARGQEKKKQATLHISSTTSKPRPRRPPPPSFQNYRPASILQTLNIMHMQVKRTARPLPPTLAARVMLTTAGRAGLCHPSLQQCRWSALEGRCVERGTTPCIYFYFYNQMQQLRWLSLTVC